MGLRAGLTRAWVPGAQVTWKDLVVAEEDVGRPRTFPSRDPAAPLTKLL